MSIRSGPSTSIRAAATYAEADTWYECDETITMGNGADQLRLYLVNTADDCVSVSIMLQVKDHKGDYCDVVEHGLDWKIPLFAGECKAVTLIGANLCTRDTVKVFFKCANGASSAVLEIGALAHNSEPAGGPIGDGTGGYPVHSVSLTTQAIDFYFIQPRIANILTAADATIDTHAIEVPGSSGILVGDYVGVFWENRFYFGTVLAVVVSTTDTITFDSPLDYSYPTGSTVLTTTREMNVDATASRQIFQIGPVFDWQENQIDINRIIFHITDASTMEDTTFGGIAALTHGLFLRRVSADGTIQNYYNVKNNGELANLSFDLNYPDKVPAGTYALRCRYTYNGKDKHGVAVRLSAGDTLQAIVLGDDLTDLSSFRMIAEGNIALK